MFLLLCCRNGLVGMITGESEIGNLPFLVFLWLWFLCPILLLLFLLLLSQSSSFYSSVSLLQSLLTLLPSLLLVSVFLSLASSPSFAHSVCVFSFLWVCRHLASYIWKHLFSSQSWVFVHIQLTFLGNPKLSFLKGVSGENKYENVGLVLVWTWKQSLWKSMM